jgi:orotate phosphoribosyltransferase-like protein
LDTALDKKAVKKVVKNLIKKIEASKIEFDAIAFSGMSGATIAPIVAFQMDKGLLMVRHPDKVGSHSSTLVEGDYHAKRYIIIDDFIATGATIDRILENIENSLRGRAKAVGIFLHKSTNENPDFRGIPISHTAVFRD